MLVTQGPIKINKGDYLIFEISKELDFRSSSELKRMLDEQFPDNQIICFQENMIDGLTILTTQIDKNNDLIFDIDETKDIHNNAVTMLQHTIGTDIFTTQNKGGNMFD